MLQHRPTATRAGRLFPLLALLWLVIGPNSFAADLDATQELFRTGKYQECIANCEAAAPERYAVEAWSLLHARALLAVGKYPEAEGVISNALQKAETSLRLRELGIETAKRVGNPALARTRLLEINNLASARSWAYHDPPNVVALGRVALLLGADPKLVLERLYQPAREADPELREAWLASGQLALDKHDFALAAKTFVDAQKKFPNDADVLGGLAESYQSGARGKMLEYAKAALEQNPNHVPSMLLLVDHAIDAEEYDEANRLLDRAFAVNPWQPRAWAYRAVIAHLRNDSATETHARDQALKFWGTNPEVDHVIGTKLSQKYRFAEGATHQRRALAFEPGYLPAQIQLAEDLLRLGEETEGWALAAAVHQRDGYDVTAYNLVTLRGTMNKFQTLTNADFVLRMGTEEAALYGDRALALLNRAKEKLATKYGIALEKPTIVEIFPEQKDFAVRTFGMPGNPGYLGVCFGRVVTANSPASQGGSPANWEAVLWHEFCHVVTLQLTKNKMPRWLSEGISVFEELQESPAWGQRMNPRYREMILGDDLVPVSELSAAFLSPQSDLHLQFAYYQSALVVEYLVRQFGFEKLRAILRDLATGADINNVIPRHTVPMPQLEKEFAAFARERAEALGPDLDWQKPETADSDIAARLGITMPANSNNYWELMKQASELIREKKWTEAKAPLQKIIAAYPDQSGRVNAYSMLAEAHRGLNETAAERAALEKWTSLEADVPDAYLRLMELAEQTQDWRAVALNAERFLAVNPLVPQPYRFLAQASEKLDATATAISAYEKLLLLDPPDPADVHFRLARLLHLNNDPAAKRQVLQALEEAPRFREAHRLLLELAQTAPPTTNQIIEPNK